jgi:hypothetical protein
LINAGIVSLLIYALIRRKMARIIRDSNRKIADLLAEFGVKNSGMNGYERRCKRIRNPTIKKVMPMKRERLSLLCSYDCHVMIKIENATKTENSSDRISIVCSTDPVIMPPELSMASSKKNPARNIKTTDINNLNV